VEGGLLHLACGSAAHCKAASRKHSFMRLEGHELLGFLVKGNCPESMHGIEFDEESLTMKLFDLFCCHGSVLATGFKQLLINASIVTRYDVGGESLVVPGSRLGTMTKREKHRGSSHFFTTGVVLTKCSNTFLVAGSGDDGSP
jgi:hypothetical protein